MAKIVTFLDVAGRPTISINVELVWRVQDRVEANEPVTIRSKGDSVNVGNEKAEVIEIINSGVTPDYDLDENGVLKGYKDPRYAAQRAQEAAEAFAARRAAQLAAAANSTNTVASAGFGADIPEENPPEESDAELQAEADAEKISFAELKAQKAAKTAFKKADK